MSFQLILKNKDKIIENAVNWMKENHPNRTSNYNKCKRDLNFVLDAYISDLENNTDYNVRFIGESFWKGEIRQLKSFKVELAVYDFIIDYIIKNLSTDKIFNHNLINLKNLLCNIIEFGPQTSVLNIIGKRKHVYEYKDDDIPDNSTIREIFLKAWHITPSKQNIMPYRVNVLGPTQTLYKQSIYNKVVGNHVYMEEEGFKSGHISKVSGEINPHYRHILYNPYLAVFSQRVCKEDEVSPFYKQKIAEGHFMEQIYPEWTERIKGSTAIEVGLFAQNVAALCLDKNIDYSFTVCFPGDVKKWKDIPFVKHPVLLLMSIGKAKVYRRDYLPQASSDREFKTAFKNVVQFDKDYK